MFGLYRTALALVVVAHHILTVPIVGHFAVQGFFVLSGYLMTTIMHGTYGYTLKGARGFAVNRFLRLYPLYWSILLLSSLLVASVGDEVSAGFRSAIYQPNNFLSWMQNASLIYLDFFPGEVKPRLAPATWALTVELLFYLLIAIGISKSRTLCLIWLVVSLVYTVATYALVLPYDYRYSALAAGSLPFSIGATIYFYIKPIARWLKRFRRVLHAWNCFALIGINYLTAILALFYPSWLGFYTPISWLVNIALSALVTVVLAKQGLAGISEKFDSKLGYYSYPIYLSHWGVALFIVVVSGGAVARGLHWQGLILFLATALLSTALSFLLKSAIDDPVQGIRAQVKRRLRGEVSLIQVK
ncbi:acyltransferase family protein [Halochromatium roseum]|uniref:acyltransferase family protein n=1 Tax=Halochromatium roseum TaxID=391920 RepID=UPI0019117423|nr:acyltransferase [Halochromatium roseum]MBK5940355.1 hypothetical protein [Halochromatium roseum]